MSKIITSPRGRQVVEIESFYHQEADGTINYYWRPLFENKPYSWYTKPTAFKEMPYFELDHTPETSTNEQDLGVSEATLSNQSTTKGKE